MNCWYFILLFFLRRKVKSWCKPTIVGRSLILRLELKKNEEDNNKARVCQGDSDWDFWTLIIFDTREKKGHSYLNRRIVRSFLSQQAHCSLISEMWCLQVGFWVIEWFRYNYVCNERKKTLKLLGNSKSWFFKTYLAF